MEDDTPASTTMNSSTYSSGGEDNSPNRRKSPEYEAVPQSPLLRTLSSMGPHHSLVGIILITLGAFSFSCMFLFVKKLSGRANTFTVAFYRAWVEIPIALYLCYDGNENPLGPSSENGTVRKWLWVRGGMGAAAVVCFFYAIQHMPLPDAVTLQFTTPPFAAAFAVCLAGERWILLDMVGAVVCLLGVMLIAHPSWLFSATEATGEEAENSADTNSNDEDDENGLVAVAVALLGAAFAGLAYTSVRKIRQTASANVMVLYYSVLSLPVTVLGSKGFLGQWNVWSGGAALGVVDWIWLISTGVFAYTGQYLTNLGLQHESAATATLATCSQIVFTYMFELVFLHEPINLWSLAGTVIILGFMVIVGIVKMRVADDNIHETVAGEPEELALLFSAERDVRAQPQPRAPPQERVPFNRYQLR